MILTSSRPSTKLFCDLLEDLVIKHKSPEEVGHSMGFLTELISVAKTLSKLVQDNLEFDPQLLVRNELFTV